MATYQTDSDQQSYTPAKIQYLLKEAGVTQKQIAAELGVSEMMVSKVVHFNAVSHRIMVAIARRIGEPHHRVFAWYYGSNRTRRASKAA